MKVPNITGLLKVGKNFVLANRPEILFGTSVTATVASVVLAFKGGYDARGIVDVEQEKRLANNQPPLDTKEKIQVAWKTALPAGLTTIGAVGATTGLHIVHVKDKKMMAQAALAAIDEVKKASKEYVEDLQDAVEENTTPKTQEKIENAFEEKRLSRDPLYWVRDARTGRSFLSTESRIQAAINEVNQLLNHNRDVSVNDFYVWAGVPEVEGGDEIGWSGSFVTLHWDDSHDEDGTPLREFSFSPRPQAGFDDLPKMGP